MRRVSVTLLNGFSAVVDGVPVSERSWRLKKARELVKLLALARGHRLHREQVMDVLWPDREPAAAANNLHQAVYVARRALDADAIAVHDEVISLAADVDVDVDSFERAAADARRARTPAAYRGALALYSGDLLPENRYDDWATERRDELAELAEELGDELAGLHSGEPERIPTLPADASSFIGRDRELAELRALLRCTRVLTLAGTGGVGKTRLALELARAAAPSYPGGAALVELAALGNATLVIDAVAAALDVRALSGQSVVDAVVEFLAPRSVLLILDNCEHLLGATASLADTLLRAAPHLTVLATSREPLHVAGEVVFRVPSLGIPGPDQVADALDLLSYEAVRLFVERAQAAAPDFTLDGANALDVARICLRLDGLPLALELAAARLGALGPAAICERLDDRFRVLRSISKAAPTRQHTLAAALQWSHDLLESDERTLFRRLAVFSGGFDLDAVESVCADELLDRFEIADVLARLVEKSLVTSDEGSSRERRYRLLETVRLYARERLAEAAESDALALRHGAWALALADAWRTSPRLDREAANLRSALDTLLAHAPHDALRLCTALLPFWLRRIELHEARRRFDEALAVAPERSPLGAEALLAAAAIDYRSGVLTRARMRIEESYAIACELGDAKAQWRSLQFLGELGIATDTADVAAYWLERALELARREGFAAAEAVCVYSLGVVDWIRGDLVSSEALVTESLDRFGALAGSDERIPSPVNIAEIRMSKPAGRTGLRVVFEDSLQPFSEISCDAAVTSVLASRAGLVRARGDLGRARAMLAECAARTIAVGDEVGQAAVMVRQAYLELADGAPDTARRALEQALALRRAQTDRRGVGLVLAGLGLIETTAADYRSAERHLAEARDIFRRAGDRWGLASTLWRTADLAIARGRLDLAEAALLEARRVLAETGRDRWVANTLAGLAEVAVLRGELPRAVELLTEARDRYAARDDALGVQDIEASLKALATPALSSSHPG